MLGHSELSWKEHVKRTCAKAAVKLRKIEKAPPILRSRTKKLLIDSLVMPYCNYCGEDWSSASKTCLKRFAKQFKRSQELRGINCDQRENSLHENIQKNIAIMIFKSLNDLPPVYLKQFFRYSTDVHGHSTRAAEGKNLYVPQKSNTWQRKTFKARGIKIWNNLTTATTKLNSLLLFKTAL